jgi:hypothetical protein
VAGGAQVGLVFANTGRGIRTTVEATDDALAANLRRPRAEALRQGTTYLETKTG